MRRVHHNPQISKVDDTYVLVFLLNKHSDENGSKQEVGIATARSLEEPWTESPHNPVLKASEENGMHVSNPTFVVAPDGKFRLYHKTFKIIDGEEFREISLAVSDKIEGPYEMDERSPVITYADQGADIEDPYAFYYMILEGRQDVKGY